MSEVEQEQERLRQETLKQEALIFLKALS